MVTPYSYKIQIEHHALPQIQVGQLFKNKNKITNIILVKFVTERKKKKRPRFNPNSNVENNKQNKHSS